MGFLSNRVDKTQLKPGDHIYSYRTAFTYSHHGGYQVFHFTPEINLNSNNAKSSGFSCSSASIPSYCPNNLSIPHCGIRQRGSGVRGGTCTTAKSDSSNKVLHRAMYLLLNGFGKYHLIVRNCEDFALYCKTSLLITNNPGTSGQASSVLICPTACPLLLSSEVPNLKFCGYGCGYCWMVPYW